MHQLGPLRIEQPQRTAATGAEMPLAGADAAATIVFGDLRAIHAQVFPTLDLERFGTRAQVDRTSAATGGLPTDRAVALRERYRRVCVTAETNSTAVTGSLEM